MKKNLGAVAPDMALATYDPEWKERFDTALAEFGASMAWGGPKVSGHQREVLAIAVYEAFHAQFETAQAYHRYAQRNVTEPVKSGGVVLPKAVIELAAKNGLWWPLVAKRPGAPAKPKPRVIPQPQQQLRWQHVGYYHARF